MCVSGGVSTQSDHGPGLHGLHMSCTESEGESGIGRREEYESLCVAEVRGQESLTVPANLTHYTRASFLLHASQPTLLKAMSARSLRISVLLSLCAYIPARTC